MSRILFRARMFGARIKSGQFCLAAGILVLFFVPVVCAQSANQSVFATGLNNPRGLKFGSDGNLYVAEGGAGGSLSTIGLCEQVPGAPTGPGPYTGDFTARISKIEPNGDVKTVVDGLPSSQSNPGLGNLVSGVADVAFIHGKLYAILGGAGCSHGLQGTDNGVIRVNSDGSAREPVPARTVREQLARVVNNLDATNRSSEPAQGTLQAASLFVRCGIKDCYCNEIAPGGGPQRASMEGRARQASLFDLGVWQF